MPTTLASSNSSPTSAQPSDTSGSFEHSLAELEAIVHQLEDGQLGLAEAIVRYELGVKHFKNCYELLQQAERKIELLTGVAEDGTPISQPFESDAAPLADSAGRRRIP